jgi:hypothetical protein
MERRLLDTARFLYETQVDFYQRFVEAIRETGYRGAIVGSCWWAGSGISHFYNLHSDYVVGFIDRHEYYGGGGVGGRRGFEAHSPLARPGTGSLQEGFTQVADRPFGLSEWIGVNPYPWSADGVAMISVYGMGLQGWDSSFHFASSRGGFTDRLGARWNAMQPVEVGQYPTFARMVYRGDVAEAPIVSKRNVHMPSLAQGRLGFAEEHVALQTADFNAVRGDIPLTALAAGRVVVDFTERFEKTEAFDIDRYRDDGAIRSVTGQLAWTPVESLLDEPLHRQWYDPQGYFTVNTPGTRAVVGFAPRREQTLGNVTITPDNLFAVIALTAHGRDETVDAGGRLILSAVARSLNQGARYFPSHSMALRKRGSGPITLEPVRATIRIDRHGSPTVHLLDHDGRRTGKTLTVRDGTFDIDTGRDKTFYYEVVYK